VHTLLIEDKADVADAMADADLYIMNSTAEGFGLVLIEAMLNRTPWLARRIAGAIEMEEYGYTYDTYAELVCMLREFPFKKMSEQVDEAYTYAMEQRTIGKTIDDVLAMCGGGTSGLRE
jgi:glycosyltransferase involved in cell wall biosynthesis